MKKVTFQIIISVILFLVSLWCLMWVFSSSSLASGYCNSSFLLFHEQWRCRQPNIAFILWLVSGVASIVTMVLVIKNVRKIKYT